MAEVYVNAHQGQYPQGFEEGPLDPGVQYSQVSKDANAVIDESGSAAAAPPGMRALPDFDPTQFSGAFWSLSTAKGLDNGFDDLKRYLAQGNDFVKEVAALARERSNIEDTYAKALEKLNTKAAKIGDNTYGSLRSAWNIVLTSFDTQAKWHHEVGDMLRKELSEPLIAFKDDQKKDHKSHQTVVETAYKTYCAASSDCHKAKRSAKAKSKDAETTAAAHASAAGGATGKTYSEKDLLNLQKKAEKAAMVRERADLAYRDALSKANQTREDWETANIIGATKLQRMEQSRILKLKDCFLRYSRTWAELLPKMTECFEANQSISDAIDIDADIREISSARGCGPFQAVHELYEVFEEDPENVMDATRRQQVLTDRLEIWKQELEKREKTRAGLANLLEASTSLPRQEDGTLGAASAVQRQIVAFDHGLAATHATLYKLRKALAFSGTPVPQSHLSEFIRPPDKAQSLHCELRLPVDFAFDHLKAAREAALNASSDSRLSLYEEKNYYAATVAESAPAPSAPAPAAPTTAAPPPPAAATNPFGGPTTAAPPPPPQPAGAAAEDDDFDDFADDDDWDDDETGAAPSAAASVGGPAVIFQCRANYDYVPTEDDELAIRVGDIVDVYEKEDETWWRGCLDGSVGVFPAAYVVQI